MWPRLFTVFTMSDQRDKILGCACDLYLEQGLEGFSMRKLAKEVGVTAPALYRHYQNREDVLTDVVREAFREFLSRFSRALEGRTAQERFLLTGEAYLDFALQHPRWYQLLFITPEHVGMEALPDDIEAMGCAVHQFWIDRVRECMEEAILEPDDPVEASMTMWAHLHGLVSLYHHGHFRMDERTFRLQVRRSARVLMRGVATEAFVASMDARDATGCPDCVPDGSAPARTRGFGNHEGERKG